jgi:hypothetical protein
MKANLDDHGEGMAFADIFVFYEVYMDLADEIATLTIFSLQFASIFRGLAFRPQAHLVFCSVDDGLSLPAGFHFFRESLSGCVLLRQHNRGKKLLWVQQLLYFSLLQFLHH